MLITLENRRLKDLFFISFTTSAYIFHEISPFDKIPQQKLLTEKDRFTNTTSSVEILALALLTAAIYLLSDV